MFILSNYILRLIVKFVQLCYSKSSSNINLKQVEFDDSENVNKIFKCFKILKALILHYSNKRSLDYTVSMGPPLIDSVLFVDQLS